MTLFRRPLRGALLALGMLAALVAASLVASGCGSATVHAAAQAKSSPSSSSSQGDSLTMYVFRGETHIMGPDGNHHDTVVPADFVVHKGVALHVTVINYDEGPHTITADDPSLGINAMIAGGKEVGDTVEPVTSHFTITINKTGVFRWHCVIPCDKGGNHWAMSKDFDGMGRDGYMAGQIISI